MNNIWEKLKFWGLMVFSFSFMIGALYFTFTFAVPALISRGSEVVSEANYRFNNYLDCREEMDKRGFSRNQGEEICKQTLVPE